MLNKSTSKGKGYKNKQMEILTFIVELLWGSSMVVCFCSIVAYSISKGFGENHDCSIAALCAYISSIVTIITTIPVWLLSTMSIKTAIFICIIATIFFILFFILHKNDKEETEMEYVLIRVKGFSFYKDERRGGVLKIRRNRKVVYNSHIKTLYRMFRISDKFETEEAEKAFMKEFVNDEITALKDTLSNLSNEMEYETKIKDEEILKAYRKLKVR